MSDVGRQLQHGLVGVDTLRQPLHNATHDEGVPQIMNARRVMRAAINPSQLFSQTGEDAFHLVGGQWQSPSPTACADEERGIALCR